MNGDTSSAVIPKHPKASAFLPKLDVAGSIPAACSTFWFMVNDLSVLLVMRPWFNRESAWRRGRQSCGSTRLSPAP